MNYGFDKKKLKQIKELILFFAVIVLALLCRKEVGNAIVIMISILRPFLYGGVIAFVLNLPLNIIEKKMLKNWNGKNADKMKRPVSVVLSILFVILILVIVVSAVVPQLTKTVVELGNKIPVFAENAGVWLEGFAAEYPQLQGYVAELETLAVDWDSLVAYIVEFLKNGVSDMVLSTVTVAGNIIGAFLNFFIGFVFAIYILSGKEKLENQGRRILSAYLPEKRKTEAEKVLHLLYVNFSNFVSGQCLEAVILGGMFVVSMTIFQLPYAMMVGVLIAFTALIPIVGAFIGCFVGAFLIFVDDPIRAVVFVALFLVLQQIEGNLIYPKVVGNKVGLPAIWVLAAVSIGGSLFGIPGMLFFIPLVSTVYILIRDSVNERNRQKEKKGNKEAKTAPPRRNYRMQNDSNYQNRNRRTNRNNNS